MDQRLNLHNELVEILGTDYVYFQPPASRKLTYPCIIYHRKKLEYTPADNVKYTAGRSYKITAVYTDPDDDLPEKIFKHFRFCNQDTDTYVVDNLYHDIFTIYY